MNTRCAEKRDTSFHHLSRPRITFMSHPDHHRLNTLLFPSVFLEHLLIIVLSHCFIIYNNSHLKFFACRGSVLFMYIPVVYPSVSLQSQIKSPDIIAASMQIHQWDVENISENLTRLNKIVITRTFLKHCTDYGWKKR